MFIGYQYLHQDMQYTVRFSCRSCPVREQELRTKVSCGFSIGATLIQLLQKHATDPHCGAQSIQNTGRRAKSKPGSKEQDDDKSDDHSFDDSDKRSSQATYVRMYGCRLESRGFVNSSWSAFLTSSSLISQTGLPFS